MSFREEQENIFGPHELAKNSRQMGRRCHKGDTLLHKKLANHVIVSKTLYDPGNTLSNRAKKRLLKNESWNDLQPNVQYSLNKHQRWKTFNVPALLDHNHRSGLEVLVVNRVITPRRSADIGNLNVSDVHVEDNGTISTISTKGKGQKFSHFQAALKEKKHAEKDEVEPAKILIDVVEPHPIPSILAGKTQRNNKKGAWATKSRGTKSGILEYHEINTDHKTDAESDMPAELVEDPRPSFTLGDFLIDGSSLKSTSRGRVRKPSSWSFVDSQPESSAEYMKAIQSIQPKPADLVDISAITNAASVFEVVDFETRKLQNFNFSKTISLLEQERLVVRRIDQQLVMVDATYQARLSGDEPIRKPLLIFFFELREDGRLLRVRINANARYQKDLNRESLIQGAERQKDFMSLFRFIIETVRSLRLRELDDSKQKSRCSDNPGYFASEVNSEALAVKADRCHEYDRLAFLREVEGNTVHHKSAEPECSSICYHCLSSMRSDLFQTADGMACKECIASEMVHQLRLNRTPVDISLTPTTNVPSIDLLYAVLPAPLISEVTKVSYSYYHRLREPNFILSKCPRCSVDVAIIPSEEDFKSCICPECESHWCWQCRSEPHWPMSCEEFKQWIGKWDQQYFVDKYRLLPNEHLLRITCTCSNVLYLPSESAHNTICRCRNRYDKTGLMSWDYMCWPYYPRLRKERNAEGKPKEGQPVTVEQIASPRLIAKEFSDICTEARNLRFDKKRRLEFEKLATASNLESFDLVNQRRTGLVLVENCTAWLYLHRRDGACGMCKSAVSRLLKRLRLIESEINGTSPSAVFLQNAEDLRKDIDTVLHTFREQIRKLKE